MDFEEALEGAGLASAVGATVIPLCGFLYFIKKLKEARHRAQEDRQTFKYLVVPLLMMSALGLWLLFFANPFRSPSVRNISSPVIGGIDFSDLSGLTVMSDTKEKSLGKKFLWGFICGLTSVVAFRNYFPTTNMFIKAFVLQ